MAFVKAQAHGRKLRAMVQSPSGGGKTTTSLRIATGITQREGGRIAVIDTEEGRSLLEAPFFDFDCSVMPDHSPGALAREIRAAKGHTVLIIDSATKEWEHLLREKDDMPVKDQFTGWGRLNPKHDEFMTAIATFPGHVIITLRSKTRYEIQQVEKNGRTVSQPVKLGMEPIARPNTEFEFDLALELDHESRCTLAKRPRGVFKMLDGYSQREPGEELGHLISDALRGVLRSDAGSPSDGAPTVPTPAPAPQAAEPPAPQASPSLAPVSPAEEAARVREELNALATFFGGMDRLLMEVGKPKPTKLTEAKAVLVAAKDLHAYRLREQQEADAAFSLGEPASTPKTVDAAGKPALQVLDGGSERPTTDRAEKAREVVAHGEGAAKGGKAQARGPAKTVEPKANPDRPTDEEWAAFYARADDGTHGTLTRDEIRDDFLRVMGLDSAHDATRAHLKRYLLSMEHEDGIAVGDPGDTENGDREDDDPANAHAG